MRTVVVNGDGLTVEDVVDVASGEADAELAPSVPATMERSRAVVAAAIEGDAPVYGVNTGFGALADTRVGEKDLARLQGAIVRSHAAATGEPLDDATVRALLLLRARTLAAGYSGVRPQLPARLIELLNLGLLPVVPGKGSVGASGDLAQLAHLAQPLIGEGRLRGPGDPPQGRPAAQGLAEHGIAPLELAPKEGLSPGHGPGPVQALLAAKAGASFVSPFVGRLDDVGHDGMQGVEDIRTIFDNYGYTTEIIVASVRHPLHVHTAALIGADICTIPFSVLAQLIKHPLTDIGIERFLADWDKAKK